MVERTVDARGLSCPEPVLLSKEAIDGIDRGTIEVLVDTVTSRDNISRLAERLACRVEAKETADGAILLCIRKG